MSQDIPGLVETSTNLASVKMKPDHIIRIETSQRSSILSARNDMANTVRAVFRLAGAEVTFGEGYPGWKPNPHSPILEVAAESYKRLFGVEAKVKAIHAGLECGLFLDKYPTLDMISFGPTLTGVHSPDERMLIPTVEKFWKHLLDILVHVPAKNKRRISLRQLKYGNSETRVAVTILLLLSVHGAYRHKKISSSVLPAGIQKTCSIPAMTV